MTNASSSQEIKQILKKGIELKEKIFKALVNSSEILLSPLQLYKVKIMKLFFKNPKWY